MLAMADYRRPPPPPPPPDTVRPDPRRTSSAEHAATRPITMGELDARLEVVQRRLLSELREELSGQRTGLEEHVRRVVVAELEPYKSKLEKLDRIETMLAEMRADSTRYRLEREVREKLEAEARAAQDRTLDIASKLAGIEAPRVENSRKYKLALAGVLVTIVTALAGLVGAAIASHGGGK